MAGSGNRTSKLRRRAGPSTTTPSARASTRGRRLGGGEIVAELNQMVAMLIAENRKLQREIVRLVERASARAAPRSPTKSRSKSSRLKKQATAGRSKRKPVKAAPARKRKPPAKKSVAKRPLAKRPVATKRRSA